MIYQTKNKDLIIRDAKIEDASLILDLIKSIAVYEKMENEVINTKEKIEKVIFEEKKAFVILAFYKDKISGYALYFYNYSTFTGTANLYLEDIFIYEEYRKLGIGKELFRALGFIGLNNGCERIDFVCLDWNKPSLDFYKKIGASRLDEWVLHRLTKKEMKELIK